MTLNSRDIGAGFLAGLTAILTRLRGAGVRSGDAISLEAVDILHGLTKDEIALLRA